MAIDDKPTPAWTEADLRELCEERRRENPRLEFKRELPLDTDRQRAEIEHDIQGLANAGGGHLIIGVAEEAIEDGSKVASELVRILDGGFYEQLNNLLDARGDPRVPFEIYAIPADAGGTYVAVEVHGHRRPHMANDGRYYMRRNLLVRVMTEAEVADAYRQRFERERRSFAPEPIPGEDIEDRVRTGLTGPELAAYQEETGDENVPGWLSVWTHPVPPTPNLLDPRRYNAIDFQGLPLDGLWREAPLRYFHLQKTNTGFVGQLPPVDDAYPAYFVRFWPDGLLEWGDLQAPGVRPDRPEDNRLIATHAVAEYVHDFLLLAERVYDYVGWAGDTGAHAKLTHVAGYRLAVEQHRYFHGNLIVREDIVESEHWVGPVPGLRDAATQVAHDLSDRIFIAGGVENGAYFFDREGNYTGHR